MRYRCAKNYVVGAMAMAVLSITGCGTGGNTAQAPGSAGSKPKILSAAGLGLKPGEASPEGRLLIGRGQDYVPIAEDPSALFNRLESSMADRRTTAWQIVEKLLAPQMIEIGKETFPVPLWHTWYEGGSKSEITPKIKLFFQAMAKCQNDPNCKKSRTDIAKEVMAGNTQKNMAESLTTKRLTEVLHQFDTTAKAAGSADALGRGGTLFSPSFVEHILADSEAIERCLDDRTPWDTPPRSKDQFSPCMSEFPQSAVMIKAAWKALPADGTPARVAARKTDAQSMTALLSRGTWPEQPPVGNATADKMYTVETTTAQKFGLQSIHFSTKDTRDWIWISLWWSPDPNTDFGQDRPASITNLNGGVWANYKMCVTTSPIEADPAPWSSFEKAKPLLAASLKATQAAQIAHVDGAPYDKVTTWCSNPNVETQPNNGWTNCIGCHQYAMSWDASIGGNVPFESVIDPTRQKPDPKHPEKDFYPQFSRSPRRLNFVSDYTWSFLYEGTAAKIKELRTCVSDDGPVPGCAPFEWRAPLKGGVS